MATSQIRLPAPNDFSPTVLGPTGIFEALAFVSALHNKQLVLEEIRKNWFSEHASERAQSEQVPMQLKLANNVFLGMQALGLVVEQSKGQLELTELGTEVLGLKDNPKEAYRRFASHILRNGRGVELLHVANDVLHRDGHVSLTALRSELAARGFDISTNSGSPSKLRLWLDLSGVSDKEWNVDQALLDELAGTSSGAIAEWRALSRAQRELLIALRVRAIGNPTSLAAHDALELLVQRGVEFPEAQTKRALWDPLVAGGWIEQDVKAGGRGAKGGRVTATEKTLSLDADFIADLVLGDIPAELQDKLNLPLDQIFDDLESESTHVKGLALELLAMRLASDSGLQVDRFRERSANTGGGEVDLIAEGLHLHFSRWLFQCKNQKAVVRIEVLAKEIGMATLLRAQVVVIVTTSTFSKAVREYAHKAAEATAIQVVLLDKKALVEYRVRGMSALRERLHQQALDTRNTKRAQLAEVPVDSEG